MGWKNDFKEILFSEEDRRGTQKQIGLEGLEEMDESCKFFERSFSEGFVSLSSHPTTDVQSVQSH